MPREPPVTRMVLPFRSIMLSFFLRYGRYARRFATICSGKLFRLVVLRTVGSPLALGEGLELLLQRLHLGLEIVEIGRFRLGLCCSAGAVALALGGAAERRPHAHRLFEESDVLLRHLLEPVEG